MKKTVKVKSFKRNGKTVKAHTRSVNSADKRDYGAEYRFKKGEKVHANTGSRIIDGFYSELKKDADGNSVHAILSYDRRGDLKETLHKKIRKGAYPKQPLKNYIFK